MSLTGTNSYSGATVVNNGSLTVSATGCGAGYIDDTPFSGAGTLRVLRDKSGTLTMLF